jgi:hypothetical protein
MGLSPGLSLFIDWSDGSSGVTVVVVAAAMSEEAVEEKEGSMERGGGYSAKQVGRNKHPDRKGARSFHGIAIIASEVHCMKENNKRWPWC